MTLVDIQREMTEGEELVLENWPAACNAEECIIGVDEAGRGPVLGPLVYAVFIYPASKEPILKEIGAGDSKEKSLGERDGFYARLMEHKESLGWKTAVLHPQHISNCMLQLDKYNLNSLSHDTVFRLIDSLINERKARITKAFIDTLGPADKYEAKLTQRFPGIKFTVRSKADSLFPVVGAASIVAKVTRDRSLQNWMAERGHATDSFGCGYPSDPSTVAWLKSNIDPVFGYGDMVRFSWSSCDRLLQEHAFPVQWHEAEDENKDPRMAKSYKTISSFCGLQPANIC